MKKLLLLIALGVLLPSISLAAVTKQGDTPYELWGKNWATEILQCGVSDPHKLPVGCFYGEQLGFTNPQSGPTLNSVLTAGSVSSHSMTVGALTANTYSTDVEPVVTPSIPEIPTSTSPNEIINPSFEFSTLDFPDNWTSSTIVGSATYSITSTAHTGSQAFQLFGDNSNISVLESEVASGLEVGAEYDASVYARVATSSDGQPVIALFNDKIASSTEIYKVVSSSWVAWTNWGDILGGSPNDYLIGASEPTSTEYTLISKTIPAPTNGQIMMALINAPSNSGVAEVIFDDAAIDTSTPSIPGVPTSSTSVVLFSNTNPTDATYINTTSTISSWTTTGGTGKNWAWLYGTGEFILPSLDGTVCRYLGVSNAGANTDTTSTCP